MQFKLLNFYKILSLFATNLVGAFIPLIIYKATDSLTLAMVYLFCQCLSRIICNHIFKNLYQKYPQLFLVLRIIPLTIYNVFLLLIDKYMILSLILITICYGMNLSIKGNAGDIIFNYCSDQKKSSSRIASTRILENISIIVSVLSGGLFLDFNQTALIIISLVLYFVSATPILIYYIIHRKSVGFNKDYESNAVVAYKSDDVMHKKAKKLGWELMLSFFFIYTLFCIVDNFTNMYNLYLFIDNPTFTKAGYITALFNFSKTLSLLMVSYLSKKFDIYKVTSISVLLTGASVLATPYLNSNILVALMFIIFGFTYEVASYYMMNSLITRSRIIGVANGALLARQDGLMAGQMISSLFVMCVGSIMPVFYFMMIAMVVFAIYFPISEEIMRKKMVNFLQNNEIE